MFTCPALARIQKNAREITAILAQAGPHYAAQIQDRAQLIERETAHLASKHTHTQGNA